MFFVFEGVDGAGKSTQLQKVYQWLVEQGREVLLVREPGSTELGNQIRDLLLHRGETPIDFVSEMFLFMAARAQLVREQIRPALSDNKIVLCDRFLMSTIVYQGHAGPEESELTPQMIAEIGQTAIGNTMPDMTLVFDVPVDLAWQRVGNQRDSLESRGKVYLEKVRHGFLAESKTQENVHVIDAARNVDDIHHDVRGHIESALAQT